MKLYLGILMSLSFLVMITTAHAGLSITGAKSTIITIVEGKDAGYYQWTQTHKGYDSEKKLRLILSFYNGAHNNLIYSFKVLDTNGVTLDSGQITELQYNYLLSRLLGTSTAKTMNLEVNPLRHETTLLDP